MVERKFYERRIKPVGDRLFALTLLFILSPLIILLLIILSVHFNGKPFFVQKRVGKGHCIFLMLKFRSISENQSMSVFDDDQLSFIGRFVRKTSLDELPQLINVLRGEMSLIGPRPLLVEYLPFYTKEETKRHHVRPGITGLAQVNGRNKIDWGKRLKLDVTYVNQVSFFLDVRILIKTCFEVFRFSNSSFKDNKTITFIEYASKR